MSQAASMKGSQKLPLAAARRFAERIVYVMAILVLLFASSGYMLYNRAFPNPLLAFCLSVILAVVLLAAVFPSDDHVSRPCVTGLFVLWTVVSLRIAVQEYAPREGEHAVRTHLRRTFVCALWSLTTALITLAYASRRFRSSWSAVRAHFIVSGTWDLLHTASIHLHCIIDPASMQTVPIAHTSGVRIGPPTLSSYLPLVYILLTAGVLSADVRARISSVMGITHVTVCLAQLCANEILEPRSDSAPEDGSSVSSSSLLAGKVSSYGTDSEIMLINNEARPLHRATRAYLENMRAACP